MIGKLDADLMCDSSLVLIILQADGWGCRVLLEDNFQDYTAVFEQSCKDFAVLFEHSCEMGFGHDHPVHLRTHLLTSSYKDEWNGVASRAREELCEPSCGPSQKALRKT